MDNEDTKPKPPKPDDYAVVPDEWKWKDSSEECVVLAGYKDGSKVAERTFALRSTKVDVDGALMSNATDEGGWGESNGEIKPSCMAVKMAAERPEYGE